MKAPRTVANAKLDSEVTVRRSHVNSGGPKPSKGRRPASLRAVEMVRAIRDRQSRQLSRKSPEDVIAFYRAAGEAATQDAERRSRLRRPRAG